MLSIKFIKKIVFSRLYRRNKQKERERERERERGRKSSDKCEAARM